MAFASCGGVKEGFVKNKNSSDEFLVKKKSPLLIPPNYSELPEPTNDNSQEQSQDDELKKLIVKTNKENKTSKSSKNINKSLEDSLLEKIKDN